MPPCPGLHDTPGSKRAPADDAKAKHSETLNFCFDRIVQNASMRERFAAMYDPVSHRREVTEPPLTEDLRQHGTGLPGSVLAVVGGDAPRFGIVDFVACQPDRRASGVDGQNDGHCVTDDEWHALF